MSFLFTYNNCYLFFCVLIIISLVTKRIQRYIIAFNIFTLELEFDKQKNFVLI